MKATLKVLTLVAVLCATMLLHAASITVGSADSGNCYPFMCNDSGTSSGLSIDYQEVYASSAFSGPFTVDSVSWGFYTPGPNNPTILGGSYTFSWGYSAVGLALTSNLPSNYSSGPFGLGTLPIPTGGINFGPTLTVPLSFTYDPSLGDLILEVVVTDQDLVPNFTGNGYNNADETGTQVMRALCLGNGSCTAAELGALQTTFNGTPVPEPGTLVMFGSGLIGLAGIARRRFNL